MIDLNRLGRGETTRLPRQSHGRARRDTRGQASVPESPSGLARLQRHVGQHPMVAVAVGLSIGCLLGWLAKRR